MKGISIPLQTTQAFSFSKAALNDLSPRSSTIMEGDKLFATTNLSGHVFTLIEMGSIVSATTSIFEYLHILFLDLQNDTILENLVEFESSFC